MKLEKLILPSHMKKERIQAIENLGHDGYDYKKTEAALIELTKKTLEHFEKRDKE